jgi:phosphate transport system substrate-binding protein
MPKSSPRSRIPRTVFLALPAVLLFVGALRAGPDDFTVPYDPVVGELDIRLTDYKGPPPGKLRGRLIFAGTSSLSRIVDGWVDGLRRKCAEADVEYEAVGSRNAVPMFISGGILICCTSRPMSSADFEEFEKVHGYRPLTMMTGVEMWAVYVHKENPIRSVTLAELDAMWSSTRHRGAAEINDWGRLGAKGDWAKPITLYAGDRDVFNIVMIDAIARGQVRNNITLIEDRDSSAAGRKLSTDKFGAAFCKVTDCRDMDFVRPLAIDSGTGRPAAPTFAGIREGRYPLIRTPLNVYVNKRPGRPADPFVVEFFKFVYSKEGQDILYQSDRGGFPVSLELGRDMVELLTK